MATATMGLRRRVPVNNSPTPTQSSPSTSNKRSRSENNNSPLQGNLNSINGSREEPPAKKSRGTSTASKNACSSGSEPGQSSKGRISTSKSGQTKTCPTATNSLSVPLINLECATTSGGALPTTSWPTPSSMPDPVSYGGVTGLNVTGGQAGLCAGSLGMPSPIPYMAASMATFVGNATNLGKSSSVSYLDISNMTSGSLSSNAASGLNPGYMSNVKTTTGHDVKSGISLGYANMGSPAKNGPYGVKNQPRSQNIDSVSLPKKFQNDSMYDTYQPWVIKTYGDLAKTKTITIKKYARILRTLRGEEVNSAENSKFRFWVKSKGFHIGQPEGYDAKPADRIIGRHAVTSPGLDPPLYVPTQPPHNKALNGAEGTVPPGRIFKKVAIVENFFDIIHAVHVDLEGRPGKHAGQKRTYRTITETYAFLPREAVTRFLLGCTECQRRPRTPSPSNLANQPHVNATSTTATTTPTASLSSVTSTMSTLSANLPTMPLSPTPGTGLSATAIQNSPKPREASHAPESKSLFNYRHLKHQKSSLPPLEKFEKDKEDKLKEDKLKEEKLKEEKLKEEKLKEEKLKEEKLKEEKLKEDKFKEDKYNPLSITNLLKKEPNFSSTSEHLSESRRTPESDRGSSRSSASSKRRRMLPEGRTPSPQPSYPLSRPWSPGLDPKNTPIDYSLPITTTYLKHQQRILAEKNKKTPTTEEIVIQELRKAASLSEPENVENERFSPAAGLIDTNLNLLATIQHLHCQVMLALTERLRPSTVIPNSLALPSSGNFIPTSILGHDSMFGHPSMLGASSMIGHNFSIPASHNRS